MAKNDKYLGFYIGLDQNGELQRISEYSQNGDIVLSMMGKDGIVHKHHVLKGRQASTEVIIVYHLTDVDFVVAGLEEAAHTKQIIAALKEKSAAKQK